MGSRAARGVQGEGAPGGPEHAFSIVRKRGLEPATRAWVPARDAVAERVGFEPTESCNSALFKSAAFNRSATSPGGEDIPPAGSPRTGDRL